MKINLLPFFKLFISKDDISALGYLKEDSQTQIIKALENAYPLSNSSLYKEDVISYLNFSIKEQIDKIKQGSQWEVDLIIENNKFKITSKDLKNHFFSSTLLKLFNK